LGRTVGAAITNHRVLGTAEAFPLFWIAMSLLALAALAVFLPHVVAWTAATFFTLLSLMLLLRSWRLRRAGRKVER
jgi:cardiolipin synthase